MPRKQILPKICVALALPTAQQLLDAARREASAGETLLEFRLDALENPGSGPAAIAVFLRHHPECAVLATCRHKDFYGAFEGDYAEQMLVLEAAVSNGARYFDVELELAEHAKQAIAMLRRNAQFIVSYHNFEKTPALKNIVKRLEHVEADFIKLVTTATKPSDCGRILELSRGAAHASGIFLAMGEKGVATRVLAPSSGSVFTYAAPLSGTGTAPGQITGQQLRHMYRADRLTRAAKVYGVVACPVRHSISPAVHNRAFQARRMDAVYLPFLVEPGQLRDFFQFAAAVPVCGFSVTIPHKRAVVRMLDQVDALSKRIGAVNTVYRKAGKWRGANTDVAGVLTPLAKHLRLNRATVLIAGYGGAARSAACALADAGARVSITGRDPQRARLLAKFCSGTALSRQEAAAGDYDVFLNTTPLGMFPSPQESFFEERIPAEIVFDMVYNPRETRLLQLAKQQSKTAIPGIEMFVEQATRQFELWTGESAPRAVMEKAAAEALDHTL